MSDVMALDIETENYSHEIGGWNNTHMFEPTVVATWNGSEGVVYCNKSEAKKFYPMAWGSKNCTLRHWVRTCPTTSQRAVVLSVTI